MRHVSRIKPGPSSRPISYAKDGPEPFQNNEVEGQWYRCRQCGFVCSTQRDAQDGHGNGCSSETVTITEYDGTEHTGIYKATVNSGCPLCGTYRWKD